MARESFFNHPYYKLNKIFLSRIGTWPEQSFFMRCLMPIFISAVLLSHMIPERSANVILYGIIMSSNMIIRKTIRLVNVGRAHDDVDKLLDCIPPVLILSVSFTHLFNGSFNRKTILAMLERISSDWQRLGQSPNIEIIQKYAARGRFITRTYAIVMYIETVIYLVMPITPVVIDYVAPLNESRKKIFLYEAEYGVNSEDYYWPIICHSYIVSSTAIGVVIWSDVMFFAMVEHACALFEIVGINLKMVKSAIADNDSTKDITDYKMICNCIDLHKEAIVFAGLIEDSYSTSLVGVIGLWLIVLSISGVQTIMNLDKPQEMLRYGSFSIAQTVHLYFNNLPGQKLIDYSQSVYDHAYIDDWDGLSIKAQKLLLMIMKRSLRPCKLTAGKVYILSMENYSAIMKTAMSYFTVLSSMR